jgi:pSer/pThr/pTyr-binding forkhead associated (FHA) protein
MAAFAEALEKYRRAAAASTQTLAAPPRIALQVVGTPYAYRSRPGQSPITFGRQKRHPGDPPNSGNDMVLRVVGNDELSARISRQHCEIRLEEGRYYVLDHSKAGTEHNGQLLPGNTPVPLAHGDRLVVAGVVTLEVRLQDFSAGGRLLGEVEATAGDTSHPLMLEATCGELITLEYPEGE